MRPAPVSPQACEPWSGPRIRIPRSSSMSRFACTAGFAHMTRFIAGAIAIGRFSREAQRRQQVRRSAAGEPRHDLCGRRGDQHEIRPARELDVTHRGLGFLVPEIAANGAAGHGLQRGRGHEFLGRPRHDDLDVGATLAQAAHELGRLVGRDAAADAKYDIHPLFSLALCLPGFPEKPPLQPRLITCVHMPDWQYQDDIRRTDRDRQWAHRHRTTRLTRNCWQRYSAAANSSVARIVAAPAASLRRHSGCPRS